jgi:hypothetical protein
MEVDNFQCLQEGVGGPKLPVIGCKITADADQSDNRDVVTLLTVIKVDIDDKIVVSDDCLCLRFDFWEVERLPGWLGRLLQSVSHAPGGGGGRLGARQARNS